MKKLTQCKIPAFLDHVRRLLLVPALVACLQLVHLMRPGERIDSFGIASTGLLLLMMTAIAVSISCIQRAVFSRLTAAEKILALNFAKAQDEADGALPWLVALVVGVIAVSLVYSGHFVFAWVAAIAAPVVLAFVLLKRKRYVFVG